jgi:hypothetical protein
MPLKDAEQGGYVGRDIVDDFRLRPKIASEENAAHADKWLDVAAMVDRADPRDQSF